MKLGFYQEIIGTLKEVQEKDDQFHLTFVFKKTVEIPKDSLPIEKLHRSIDKRIGILYDGQGYYMSTIVDKIDKKDKI